MTPSARHVLELGQHRVGELALAVKVQCQERPLDESDSNRETQDRVRRRTETNQRWRFRRSASRLQVVDWNVDGIQRMFSFQYVDFSGFAVSGTSD